MATKKESLGIKHVASLHLFVRDLERSLEYFVDSLDFEEIGRSTPDFEADQRARASVVQAGTARFVLMEPLGSRGESFAWLAKHPEGIGRIVFDVEDAERAYMLLTARGATSTRGSRASAASRASGSPSYQAGSLTWRHLSAPTTTAS